MYSAAAPAAYLCSSLAFTFTACDAFVLNRSDPISHDTSAGYDLQTLLSKAN